MKTALSRFVRFSCLGAVLLVIAIVNGQTAANVILDETFPAVRATANALPDSAAWYYSRGSSYVTTPSSGGSMTLDANTGGTGFINLLTYFTPAGSPVSLAVGESLTAAFSFSLTHQSGVTVANAKERLRFGFYDSSGVRISSDGTGGSGAAMFNTGYKGYTAYLNTKTSTEAPLALYTRNGGNNNLGNTGAAHSEIGTRQGGVDTANSLADNVSYTGTYTITRTGDNELSITMSLVGGALDGFSGSWTTSAAYTAFDTFALVVGSGQTYDSITLNGLSITYNSNTIPEPSALALLIGAGILIAAVNLRRRR